MCPGRRFPCRVLQVPGPSGDNQRLGPLFEARADLAPPGREQLKSALVSLVSQLHTRPVLADNGSCLGTSGKRSGPMLSVRGITAGNDEGPRGTLHSGAGAWCVGWHRMLVTKVQKGLRRGGFPRRAARDPLEVERDMAGDAEVVE